MGIKHFESRFRVVKFILGLDCVEKGIKLNQGTILFLDEDDFGNLSKVAEYVVHAIMVIVLGN